MRTFTSRRVAQIAALSIFLAVTIGDPVDRAAAQADPASGCVTGVTAGVDGIVELFGTGKQNTRPFDLAGGAYTVRWSGKMDNQFGGNVIVHMKRTDGVFMSELLVNTLVSREKPTASGETQLYNVMAGPHYLDVTAAGPWTVTISPQL